MVSRRAPAKFLSRVLLSVSTLALPGLGLAADECTILGKMTEHARSEMHAWADRVEQIQALEQSAQKSQNSASTVWGDVRGSSTGTGSNADVSLLWAQCAGAGKALRDDMQAMATSLPADAVSRQRISSLLQRQSDDNTPVVNVLINTHALLKELHATCNAQQAARAEQGA